MCSILIQTIFHDYKKIINLISFLLVAPLGEDLHFLHNLLDSRDIHLEALPGSYEADLRVGGSNRHHWEYILHSLRTQTVADSHHPVAVGNRQALADTHLSSCAVDSLAAGLVGRARSLAAVDHNLGNHLVGVDIHQDSQRAAVDVRHWAGRPEVHLETVTAGCAEMVIQLGGDEGRALRCGMAVVVKGLERASMAHHRCLMRLGVPRMMVC